jgi:hypothetical protein
MDVPVVKRRGIRRRRGGRKVLGAVDGKTGEQEDKMCSCWDQTGCPLYIHPPRTTRDVVYLSPRDLLSLFSCALPCDAFSSHASLFAGTCLWGQLPAR